MKKVLTGPILISALLSSFLTALIFFSISFSFKEDKVGHIDLAQVYNEFEMTDDLNKKLEKVKGLRQSLLDSLSLQIEQLELQLRSQSVPDEELMKKYRLLYQQTEQKAAQYQQDNANMVQQYHEQVTAKIREYVKEFGEEHQYKFIYGAENSGALMYGDKHLDITEPIIAHINERYSTEK